MQSKRGKYLTSASARGEEVLGQALPVRPSAHEHVSSKPGFALLCQAVFPVLLVIKLSLQEVKSHTQAH